MARIRTIKPSIWTDERFIDLSRDARLLCVGMISNADDDGRLVASGPALIGVIYPHDGDVSVRQVERWRDEIANTGMITLYRVGRAVYAAFPNWSKHQYIQKRTRSTLPEPPDPDGSSSGSDYRTEAGNGSGSGSGSPPVLPPVPTRARYGSGSGEGKKDGGVNVTTHQADDADLATLQARLLQEDPTGEVRTTAARALARWSA